MHSGKSKCSASDAVIQRLTPQKYCNAFQNKVHVASNLRLCTVKSLHEKKNFRLTKICEKCRNNHIFVCFRFTEISYFLMFPSNENVRKQHLSASAYFCVNMNFSYMIAGCKDDIFVCRIETKTSNFLLVLRSTFR